MADTVAYKTCMLPRLQGTKEILGYTHWLVMRGQHAGNLRMDGHTVIDEERDIKRKMRSLSDFIKDRLAVCEPEEISALLDCYDLSCRIGYDDIPDQSIVGKNNRRCFNAWKKGNRSIEESGLYGILNWKPMTDSGFVCIKEYETARLALRAKWLETLRLHSYFPEATAHENYQRLAIIMRENIDDVFGIKSEEMKRRWYEYNKVDDLSAFGSQILRSYRRFATALFPDVIDYETQQTLDALILTELSARPDLNPYDRKAFRLALEYDKGVVLKHKL